MKLFKKKKAGVRRQGVRPTTIPKRPYASPRSKKTLLIGPVGDTFGGPSASVKRRTNKQKAKKLTSKLPPLTRSQLVKSLSIFIVAFVLITGLFVVFWSDAFRIKSDRIVLTLTQEDLFDFDEAAQLLDTLSDEFSFFVGSDQIFSLLSSSFPQLQQVDVSVRLPDGLSISLTSFEPRFRTVLLDDTYLIVENGALIPEPTLGQFDVPFLSVVGREARDTLRDSYLLTFDEVGRLTQMIDYFSQHTEIFPPLTGLAYYYTENEVHVFSGSRILLSVDVDPRNALDQLRELEQETLQGYLSESYTYLDLRVADRLFACPGERQTQCESNLENMYGIDWQVNQSLPVAETEDTEEQEDVAEEETI